MHSKVHQWEETRCYTNLTLVLPQELLEGSQIQHQTGETQVFSTSPNCVTQACCLELSWWVSWVLWHINPCRLFNAKSYLYIYIKYVGFWLGFMAYQPM